MINFAKLAETWSKNVTDFIDNAGDYVEVYKHAASIESPENYDEFFDESIDANDPDNVERESFTPVKVDGYHQLGVALAPKSEKDETVELGSFEDEISVFYCKAEDAETGDGKTVFHGCDYVTSSKANGKFKVKKIIPNGLNAVIEYRIILEQI